MHYFCLICCECIKLQNFFLYRNAPTSNNFNAAWLDPNSVLSPLLRAASSATPEQFSAVFQVKCVLITFSTFTRLHTVNSVWQVETFNVDFYYNVPRHLRVKIQRKWGEMWCNRLFFCSCWHNPCSPDLPPCDSGPLPENEVEGSLFWHTGGGPASTKTGLLQFFFFCNSFLFIKHQITIIIKTLQ